MQANPSALLGARQVFVWQPSLVKRLRGKRTQSEFGRVIGVPKNTVWRWEAGHAAPSPKHSELLSKLARKERFLVGWSPVGSVRILGDLEEATREIRGLFAQSLELTTRQIVRGTRREAPSSNGPVRN